VLPVNASAPPSSVMVVGITPGRGGTTTVTGADVLGA
jgi:hypothetical protein